MCKNINTELSIVNEWFCVNKLSLNLEKIHVNLFKNCKSVKKSHNKDKMIMFLKELVTKNFGICINECLS